MSRASNNPFTGAGYFLRGFGLITRPGVRLYVAIPLAINVALFAGLIYFGATSLWAFAQSMLPAWLDWLTWILVPLFLLASLAGAFFTFNLVANLIAAPFNGLLAEAVERELTGRGPADGGGWKKLVRDVGMSIGNEFRKFGYVAVRTLPLLILFVVPVVNVVASLLWMVLSAWMLAISYVDFPMGNHGIAFPEQRRVLAGRRYLGLGFGFSIMVALSIPILNFLVIPCAVAGATAMWVDEFADDEPPPGADAPARIEASPAGD